MAAPPGYGLIGCGSFGLFCLEQYRSMPGIRCVAAADARPEAARAAAERFGLAACASPGALLAREDVELVHIATPPFTHRELALAALDAGKHVLCEKPLATTPEDGRAIVEAGRAAGRLVAVNLIMRYDPLCEAVGRIVSGRLLGEPLHGFFENDAKDEPLPPGHWFWDRSRSGGIFIEHGVHFFDLFAWWLGPGRVLAAQEARRPGTDLVEHVRCTVRYGEGVLVSFYHGFHQASRMDRQELRLAFERGSLSLQEWVPTRLRVDAILDRAGLEALVDLLPGAEVREIARYEGPARRVTSRHKTYDVDLRVAITCGAGMEKEALYGHVLRALLADQAAAIRDPMHPRRVTEAEGLSSLETAVAADRLARGLATGAEGRVGQS